MAFDETESGLLVDRETATLTATDESLLVAFRIDPEAPITRQGTIGR